MASRAKRVPGVAPEPPQEVVAIDERQLADYLTSAEVSARYRTPESTIRYWRMIDYGPRGVKVGARVLYPRAEIERFDAELADKIKAS